MMLASGKGFSGDADQKIENDELIGLQGFGAPMSKLLVAIVSQAISDNCSVVSFVHQPNEPKFYVNFWSSLEGIEPSGEKREATTIPSDLATALFSYALWSLNHQDPRYEKVRSFLFFDSPNEKLATWPDDLPCCRCWLRDPKDVASLVIQVVH
jgi:hypothetical protein